MVSWNVSESVSPFPSSTVTVMSSTPLKFERGVIVKSAVVVSPVGLITTFTLPFWDTSVTLQDKVVLSISVAETSMVKGVSSLVSWLPIEMRVGGSLTGST